MQEYFYIELYMAKIEVTARTIKNRSLDGLTDWLTDDNQNLQL